MVYLAVVQETELLFKGIGKRLKELRINAGYSNYEDFAYDAGISRPQYGRYERGVNLTIESLYKILKFHKITFAEFFGEDFQKLDRGMKK